MLDSFITHTGRAVPLRYGGVDTGQILPAVPVRREGAAGFGDGLIAAMREDPRFVLSRSPYAGATILICGPGSAAWPAHEQAAHGLACHGFRVVISPAFGDILYNEMIQAGIVPARLPVNAVDNLLRAVEADPPIPLEVDLARRQVSASGEPCWTFEIAEYARQRLMAGTDVLADQLLAAQRGLDSCDLDADQRFRLQRRLMAICDAMKAPGADQKLGKRRLGKFLEELDRRSSESRIPCPASMQSLPGSTRRILGRM
jgi:3-isopropylmalate/(R)-2-methylmalate dehydratase small subunit